MGRTIDILYCGEAASLAIEKVDRKKLYGWKRRVGLDGEGRECEAARLTRDGRHILPPGSTASLHLDASGDAVERKDLAAADAEGDPLASSPFASSDAREIGGPVEMDEFLNHTVEAVYQVEEAALPPALASALERGDVYRLSLRLRSDGRDRPAFLLMGEEGPFLLAAEPCGFDYVGCADVMADAIDEEEAETEDGEFDFGVV